jgi:hypothetical protein
MPTVSDIKSLEGAEVAIRLTPAAGGEALDGRLVGTLESADGLVVFIEPSTQPGGRLSYNYQHIATIEPR